jgi:ElaA protein
MAIGDDLSAAMAQHAAGMTVIDPVPVDAQLCLRTFDQLSTAELYQLLQLRSTVFVLEQQCLYQDIDGVDDLAMHLLVRQNQLLLGYGRLLPPSPDCQAVRIGRIVIAAEFRSAGHGRWLIKLLRACSSRNWPNSSIELSAQAHLQSLYVSCGFIAISDPYDEDGISHIDMRWQA